MSYYAFKNNLKTTLHYDMTDTDTVIRLKQLVTSTDPAVRLAAWPTCDAEHAFTLTLTDSVTDAIEIVECTEVTANEEGYITFSCQRAQEGTTATAHVITNTSVEHRLTAAALNAMANRFADTINVKAFGAVGDGVTDDTAAIQAAIDYTISVGNNGYVGKAIYIPSGKYKITSTLKVPSGVYGFTLYGDGDGIASIESHVVGAALQIGDDAFFQDGADTAGLGACLDVYISGIKFRARVLTGDTVGLLIGFTPYSVVSECQFEEFNIAISGYRCNSTKFTDLEFRAYGRETAEAFIRLRGVYNSTTAWTPGGNLFFSNLNFQGNSTRDLGMAAIKVNCVDGLYIDHCHAQFARYSLLMEPLNDTVNQAITDVRVDTFYFDDPSGNYSNVAIQGTMTPNTLIQGIQFVGCLFRGATNANYGLFVNVASDISNSIKDVAVDACTFRQHRKTPIQILGPTSGKALVNRVRVSNCLFTDGNYLDANYSIISQNGGNLHCNDNILNEENAAPALGIMVWTPTRTYDTAVIMGNDFRKSIYTGDNPLAIPQTSYTTLVTGNMLRGISSSSTFIATLTSGATTQPTCLGRYVKNGNIVSIFIELLFGAIELNGTAIKISGLPFANNGPNLGIPATPMRSVFNASGIPFWLLATSGNNLELKEVVPNSGTSSDVVSQAGTFAPNLGRLSFSYITSN